MTDFNQKFHGAYLFKLTKHRTATAHTHTNTHKMDNRKSLHIFSRFCFDKKLLWPAEYIRVPFESRLTLRPPPISSPKNWFDSTCAQPATDEHFYADKKQANILGHMHPPHTHSKA